ncbi:RAN binding protein 1 [Reticulomyxa filosa]|uniref:RAN binding protein 1 n=1 Tax=Reticulomyxa filosa TaxID=46433 RepID=X6MH29_RETFI|nr:RAN binding protein 1 [Reticulomyxa filosa]|eukprot:ETO12355.1 RAN binding protein 1 [Reticulomyxa filosa]
MFEYTFLTKSNFPKKESKNLNDIWCSSEWDAVTKENVNPHDNVKNNKQDESKLETEHDKHDEHDNVEENCVDYNLKPIIHLTEQTQVSSGTEDETQIHQFSVKKLYRWSKDTTGEQGWKTRAIESVIELWKSNTTGRLRMICRENLTGKLRLNQNVGKDIVVTEKPSFHCQWSAFDATIAQENGCQGFSMWLAKFTDVDTSKAFQRVLSSLISSQSK